MMKNKTPIGVFLLSHLRIRFAIIKRNKWKGKKKMRKNKILGMSLALIFIIFVTIKLSPVWGNELPSSESEYINAKDFGAIGNDYIDDKNAIQAAIDYAQTSGIGKVKLTGNKEYLLNSGIILKKGVELELGNNTKLMVNGNFKAIQLENDSSIKNGIIMVIVTTYNSDVIYLDGKYKFTSWDRAKIDNVSIINASNTYTGTALSLYAKGDNHYISYVNFSNLNINGFYTGIRLKAEKPASGNSWINANRFTNITIDACISPIELSGSKTVPNETSGNQFTNLQIQLEKNSISALKVSGQDNTFQTMIWDVQNVTNKQIVHFTSDAVGNKLSFNLNETYIKDEGAYNYFSSVY